MKRKVLIATISLSVLFVGVVSAASLWGTYKGNNIIRVTSEGKQLRVGDVPAISYNGRTMIPINMLNQIGVSYTWDSKNQTVDVNTQNVTTILNTKNYIIAADIFKSLEDVGEELRIVSQVFDHTVTAQAADIPLRDDFTKRLNNAINSYNSMVDNATVKMYGLTVPEINTILNQYNESINDLKANLAVVNKMIETSYKPDIKFYEDYVTLGMKTDALITSGTELSQKKYAHYINLSTK
ncbi:stalk domain-containing protein [Paenibacillus dakarensis]|uniref:stalk domain-containing protein n=1 Tax=Paenibacillus dakarensis TaxID=1527293 RepID=UPI0006D548B6|nr:stalk domain-containing protein [Paenibacillus dakarensis]